MYAWLQRISFFRGAEFDLPPSDTSKRPLVRYRHKRVGDKLGEQFADCVCQASRLPRGRM